MLPFSTMTVFFLVPVQINYNYYRSSVSCLSLIHFILLPGALDIQGTPFCFFFPPADFHNLTLLSLPFWARPCSSICVAHPVVSKMMNEKREEESICSLWTDCLMEEKDSSTHYWIFMNFCHSNVTYTTVKRTYNLTQVSKSQSSEPLIFLAQISLELQSIISFLKY